METKGKGNEGEKLDKSLPTATYACGLILNCIEYCFFLSKMGNEN